MVNNKIIDLPIATDNSGATNLGQVKQLIADAPGLKTEAIKNSPIQTLISTGIHLLLIIKQQIYKIDNKEIII